MKIGYLRSLLIVASTTATLSLSAIFARSADAPPPSQGAFAVIVGIAEYSDPAISARPTAEADAKALFDLLRDPKYRGIPADRMILLTTTPDAARNGRKATRESILAAIKEAVSKTGKDDLIFVGLYGRAAPVGIDKFAMLAPESTVADRAKNGISGSDFAVEFKNVKSQQLCAFLDLSFKGIDAGKEALPEPNVFTLFGAIYGTSSEEKEVESDEETIQDKAVLLSCLPGSEPLMQNNRGIFTTIIETGLRGAADSEGYEADGTVTIDELSKYLEKEATTQARTIGKTPQEKETIPVAAGVRTSHYWVTRNPAAYPTAEKRLKEMSELATKGGLPKEFVEEGTNLLTRMPKLKNLQELRKKYQDLTDGKLALSDFPAARAVIKDAMKLAPAKAANFTAKVQVGIDAVRIKYVKSLNEADLIAGSIRGMYKRLDVPIPKEINDKLTEIKTLNFDAQTDLMLEARTHLGEREDLADGQDVDLALGAMAESIGDPHTRYYDKETIKKEESRLRSEYSGIGVHIRRDLARDGILVVSPIKGSPAYNAGMKAGDLIIEVRREVDPDGLPLKEGMPKVVSLRGVKTEKAIETILGKPGTPVSIVVEREGATEPIVLDINRGRVSLETVFGVSRDEKDDWKFMLDDTNKIGYVYIGQFGPRTADELLRVLQQLSARGMKGFVLDLRFNPGGSLGGALDISDAFIESGLILKVTPRVGKEERYYDRGDPAMNFNRSKFPMAVLINGGSASASEIVSSVMQDYDRATIIGERTYGKGSVQQVDPFSPTGGVFKLTTARYFPPLGRNIDKRSTPGKPEDEWGVSPNKGFEIKLSREETADLAEALYDKEHIGKLATPGKAAKPPFKDRQLDAATEHLRKEIQALAALPGRKAG